MWLDGIYMAGPFMSEYALRFDDPETFDDVTYQITVTNTTISGNSCATRGGGVDNNGVMVLVNSTIVYNTSQLGIPGIGNRGDLYISNSIAAYNTGAGNVAYAFSGTYNIKNALAKINAMSPDEVFSHLQKNLRYKEPKVYMQRVISRMVSYHKVYGEEGTRRQKL